MNSKYVLPDSGQSVKICECCHKEIEETPARFQGGILLERSKAQTRSLCFAVKAWQKDEFRIEDAENADNVNFCIDCMFWAMRIWYETHKPPETLA